jgi:hypothetical protein
MRVVLDTNILVSAVIAPAGKPAAIVRAWLEGNSHCSLARRTSTSCAARCKSRAWPSSSSPTRPAAWSTRSGNSQRMWASFRAWNAPRSDRRFSAGPRGSGPGRLSRDRRQERSAGPRQSQGNPDHRGARLRRTTRMKCLERCSPMTNEKPLGESEQDGDIRARPAVFYALSILRIFLRLLQCHISGCVFPGLFAGGHDSTGVETNVYAVSSGEGQLLWTAVSDTFNPSSSKKVIHDLSKLVVKELQKEAIL